MLSNECNGTAKPFHLDLQIRDAVGGRLISVGIQDAAPIFFALQLCSYDTMVVPRSGCSLMRCSNCDTVARPAWLDSLELLSTPQWPG